MSAHHPDAIERVARAMFVACYGAGHTITYDRLQHDGDPETVGIFCKPYWHRQAAAALSVIDALYADEGGEVPHEP